MKLAVLCLAAAGVTSAPCRADDTLREGQAASVGARTDGRILVTGKADLAILPSPLGPDFWGGPINGSRLDLTLGMDSVTGEGIGVDHARAQVLRWPHLRVLGFERDTSQGQAFGVEVLSAHVPVALAGKMGSRSWVIATMGAGVGYSHQTEGASARRDADVGILAASCRIDSELPLSERVHVRPFAEAIYRIGAGSIDGVDGLGFEHLMTVAGGASLQLDVSRAPARRRVPRTDPATGEVSYRYYENEGKRFRINLLDVSGEARPVDTITDRPSVTGTVKAGFSYEFH